MLIDERELEADASELGQQEVAAMQRWEYEVKRIDTHPEPQDIADTLTTLGTEGWELVTVVQVIGTHALASLKRPAS